MIMAIVMILRIIFQLLKIVNTLEVTSGSTGRYGFGSNLWRNLWNIFTGRVPMNRPRVIPRGAIENENMYGDMFMNRTFGRQLAEDQAQPTQGMHYEARTESAARPALQTLTGSSIGCSHPMRAPIKLSETPPGRPQPGAGASALKEDSPSDETTSVARRLDFSEWDNEIVSYLEQLNASCEN